MTIIHLHTQFGAKFSNGVYREVLSLLVRSFSNIHIFCHHQFINNLCKMSNLTGFNSFQIRAKKDTLTTNIIPKHYSLPGRVQWSDWQQPTRPTAEARSGCALVYHGGGRRPSHDRHHSRAAHTTGTGLTILFCRGTFCANSSTTVLYIGLL